MKDLVRTLQSARPRKKHCQRRSSPYPVMKKQKKKNPITGIIQMQMLRHTLTREVALNSCRAMQRHQAALYLTVASRGERVESQGLRPTGPGRRVHQGSSSLPDVPISTETVPRALQRLHRRLMTKTELYELHIKHYHMTPTQFRRCASELALP